MAHSGWNQSIERDILHTEAIFERYDDKQMQKFCNYYSFLLDIALVQWQTLKSTINK